MNVRESVNLGQKLDFSLGLIRALGVGLSGHVYLFNDYSLTTFSVSGRGPGDLMVNTSV